MIGWRNDIARRNKTLKYLEIFLGTKPDLKIRRKLKKKQPETKNNQNINERRKEISKVVRK